MKHLDVALYEFYYTAFDRMTESLNELNKSFSNVARANGKSTYTAICYWFETIKRIHEFEDSVISVYPNKRVRDLALHGYGRTRKKNRNRILKHFEKGGNYDARQNL